MRLAIRMYRQEDGTYRASCPALPGCTAFGETRQQAEARIHDAIVGYLASLGASVPERPGSGTSSAARSSAVT